MKLNNSVLVVAAFFCLLFHGGPLSAEVNVPHQTLSLETYLEQVQEGNKNWQSLHYTRTAYQLRKEEGDLLYSPQFFSQVQVMDDKKETSAPTIMGNETVTTSATLGVGKLTSFGLSTKLTYQIHHISIEGTSPGFLAAPRFFNSIPGVELSFPLLKNFMGRETQRTREAIKSQAEGNSLMEDFKLRLIMLEAEGTYYKLLLSREMVEIQQEILERNIKIRQWSARRAELQLGDRSDLLQAEAAVAARKLELTMSQDDLKGAERAFNTLRGRDEVRVAEKLPVLPENFLDKMEADQTLQYHLRDDLRAAKQLNEALKLQASNNKEKFRPNLDVFTNLSFNGKDSEASSAVSESLGPRHAVGVLGVKINFPLDGDIIQKQEASFEKEIQGAEMGLKYREFKDQRDFQQLREKLMEASSRFKMLKELEKIQREKVGVERDRHQRGRSTTYQVLLFEQDLAGASLLRLKTQGEILNLLSQLKTYKETQNQGGGI